MRMIVAILIILGATLAGGALAFAAQRVRAEIRRGHHEIGTAVFLQLGVIFAVLLAFVFNEVWGEYDAAAQAIDRECASLHGVAIAAEALPDQARKAVDQALDDYLATVIREEWPSMARQRQPSEAATRAFHRLWRSIGDATGGAPATAAQMLNLVAAAHQNRSERLFQMTLGVPPLLWSLLVLLALAIIVLVGFAGMDYVLSQAAFTALLAGAIAFILVVVQSLDYPFEGMLALSSADFQETLAKIAAPMNSSGSGANGPSGVQGQRPWP